MRKIIGKNTCFKNFRVLCEVCFFTDIIWGILPKSVPNIKYVFDAS